MADEEGELLNKFRAFALDVYATGALSNPTRIRERWTHLYAEAEHLGQFSLSDIFPNLSDSRLAERRAEQAGTHDCVKCGFTYYLTVNSCPACGTGKSDRISALEATAKNLAAALEKRLPICDAVDCGGKPVWVHAWHDGGASYACAEHAADVLGHIGSKSYDDDDEAWAALAEYKEGRG